MGTNRTAASTRASPTKEWQFALLVAMIWIGTGVYTWQFILPPVQLNELTLGHLAFYLQIGPFLTLQEFITAPLTTMYDTIAFCIHYLKHVVDPSLGI